MRIKAVSGVWLWVLGQGKYLKAVVTKSQPGSVRVSIKHSTRMEKIKCRRCCRMLGISRRGCNEAKRLSIWNISSKMLLCIFS